MCSGEIHQIPHITFENKSQYFFQPCIILASHALDKRSASKCTFLDFRLLAWKITYFLVILQAMSQFSCKLCIRGHLKSTFVEEGRVGKGKSLKSEQKQTGVGGPSIHVRFFLKKMLRSSKWSFKVILQFFLLIIMAVWNITQTIMKDCPFNA